MIGKGEMKVGRDHTLIFSGKTKHHSAGVGFIMNNEVFKSVISYNAVSPRIISMRLKGQGPNTTLFQVYAPTSQSTEDEIEQFYTKLQREIDRCANNDQIMVMGDFNAKVGNQECPGVMGKFGYGDPNERGLRLIEFCQENKLVITNTMFNHRASRKWTWESPNHRDFNMIDYILIQQRWRSSICNTRAFPGIHIGSDHKLVMTAIKTKFRVDKMVQIPAKIDTLKLQDEQTKLKYELELKNKFEALNYLKDVEINNAITQMNDILKKTGIEILGKRRNKHEPWISNKTLELSNKFSSILKRYKTDHTLRQERNETRRAIKKQVKHDYEQWLNNQCAELEMDAKKNNSRDLFAKIKKITNVQQPKQRAIKSKDGKLLTEPEQIKGRWQEYCSELYQHITTADQQALDEIFNNHSQQNDENVETEPPISIHEIKAALKHLKNNKAAGSDEVPGELLKYGGETTAKLMHVICSNIWRNEIIPDEWTKSIIITLPKSGDTTECNNYRTISLINHASKVILEIIKLRMRKFIEENLSEYQAGFRIGRSTIDQIFTIRQLAEHRLAKNNMDIYCIFIDFKKAFDRVCHKGLFNVLRKYGVPTKLINLIMNLYLNAKSAVKVENETTDWFNILIGVRQGCLLSPDLFNIFLEFILREAMQDNDPSGLTISGSNYNRCCFADDIATLADQLAACQEQLDKIDLSSTKYGMEISETKTEAMVITNKKETTMNITLKGKPLKQVNEFKYLGSIITANNSSATDIKRRLGLATGAFGKLDKVWKNKKVRLTTKIRLLDALVLPVALYGCETWARTQNEDTRIAAFEMKCLRRILDIKWEEKVSNEKIRAKINQRLSKDRPNILSRVKIRQAVWFGHVKRMDEIRLPRIAMNEVIPLKNKPGRARQKWIDNVLKTVNLTEIDATTLAQESRELWRSSVHEGANVQKSRSSTLRSHAMTTRSNLTQRTGL